MRVEISIAKEKAAKMPKGSMEALKDEMTRRISSKRRLSTVWQILIFLRG